MAGDGRVVLWTLAKAELQHQEVMELAEGGGCGAPGAAAAGVLEDGADDLAHPLLAAGTCLDVHRVRGPRARARARAPAGALTACGTSRLILLNSDVSHTVHAASVDTQYLLPPCRAPRLLCPLLDATLRPPRRPVCALNRQQTMAM